MLTTQSQTVQEVLKSFILTPIKQPDILPTVLPLILGGLVIELYFGKHTREDLGWNTSVGNAIIWVTTGVTLLMTTPSLSRMEEYAAYSLIGTGIFIGYMDFYHKWSETVAFVVSSSGVVYTLAYIGVILIKTSTPINEVTLKASGIFFVAAMVGFKLLQSMETPQDDFALN
ncbi:hypothetical protein [Candidatus Nanohalobium constans]|uniref:Uncharacterized protein n=1 Tax=Candidatus Nanohalobium constans TaxID=2565781 RepID=A0A5Q0UG28_9ARCH|nr:hypothetical protein [Candidatus Nanohalobium constans]QGA80557.1 hypothetical protein LC1Nh_0666 [Candidatus Nanohalobium constans]